MELVVFGGLCWLGVIVATFVVRFLVHFIGTWKERAFYQGRIMEGLLLAGNAAMMAFLTGLLIGSMAVIIATHQGVLS